MCGLLTVSILRQTPQIEEPYRTAETMILQETLSLVAAIEGVSLILQ
jgi:hypothetical protein